MNVESEKKLMRRVGGFHNCRLDGVGDILTRVRGASVFDVGCSRGQIGQDFVINGATTLHGCDIDAEAVACARGWFYDFRAVESQFEVVDLTGGPASLHAFKGRSYDVTLMVATYHKLKRIMSETSLNSLMEYFASHTSKWLVWRGTSLDVSGNELELQTLDRVLRHAKMKRVHTSYISHTLGVAAIWERQ